jgi:hypothetical protein
MGRRGRRSQRIRDASLARKAAWATILGTAVAVVALVVALGGGPSGDTGSRPASTGARALVALRPPGNNAVIPKPVAQIPEPPPYARRDVGDHCAGWWRHWLRSQQAAQLGGVPTIQISAPARADAAVTDATIHVFRSYRPKQMTSIQCVRGAGPIPGTALDVDLDRPHSTPTIVADDGRDTPLSLPDAVINVSPGHTEYVAAYAKGHKRFYEWSLALRVVVDQRAQHVVLGSRAAPLVSWLGDPPRHSYDFDESTMRWRSVP